MQTMEPFEVLGVLIAFGSILFLAYITTRLIGIKSKRAMRGKYINIIESLSLGMDKQIHLVKVGRDFLLISTSGKTIEFLSAVNLDDYDPDEITDESLESFDFKSIFDKYIQTYKDKRKNNKLLNTDDKSDTSSVGSDKLKKNLDKLKSINSAVSSNAKSDGDDITNEEI